MYDILQYILSVKIMILSVIRGNIISYFSLSIFFLLFFVSKFYDRFFLTFSMHRCYSIVRGGGKIYEIGIISLSIILSYNLISYYFIKRKEKFLVKAQSNFLNNKFFSNFYKRYFLTIQENLNSLERPYKLNLTRYIFIKYIISSICSLIFIFQKRSFIQIFLIFLLLFYLPNILVSNYRKKEKVYVINDLQQIINNLQISLVTSNSLYDSLKFSVKNINYAKFKNCFLDFVEEYRMYNYNIKKASEKLIYRFNQKELKTFLEILDGSESVSNTLELMKRFKQVVAKKEESALKGYYIKTNMKVIFISLILLCMSFVIVIYPISIQILESLNTILN